MTKKDRALKAVGALKQQYPDALCSLNYTKPHELLIATMLSAQCTDARVNLVTPELFDKYKSIEEFAEANVSDVADLIHSCGFYKTKSQNIVSAAIKLRDEFNCQVPDTIEQLITLPGVGRKTANLICGDIYNKPAVVADTHLIRITNLLGLVDIKDPKAVEMQLKKLLPPEESNDFCHRAVLHGRAVCIANRPKCDICCMKEFCKSRKGDK